MTEAEEDDFRATTEALIAEAEQLKAIEEHKLELSPASPVVAELAATAEKVARRIAIKAGMEKQLAENLSTSS